MARKVDGAEGEPSLLPQGGYQAEQAGAQPLLAQCHPAQLGLGHPPPPAHRAGAGDEAVFGDLGRNQGQVDDLPGALHPAAGQSCAAIGTGVQGVFHPAGGSHAAAGEAVRPGLSPALGLGWGAAGPALGLEAGHPPGAAGLGPALQGFNPPLQLADNRLLLGYDRQQVFPGGSGQVNILSHVPDLT